MEKVKVGIELIVFRGREEKDLDGVLKECADAGLKLETPLRIAGCF